MAIKMYPKMKKDATKKSVKAKRTTTKKKARLIFNKQEELI